MSWGGSVAAMIQSLRDNKALLGKRKSYFDKKKGYKDVTKKLGLNYEKATPEQLRLIRAKLKRQRLITKVKTFIVLLLFSPVVYMSD